MRDRGYPEASDRMVVIRKHDREGFEARHHRAQIRHCKATHLHHSQTTRTTGPKALQAVGTVHRPLTVWIIVQEVGTQHRLQRPIVHQPGKPATTRARARRAASQARARRERVPAVEMAKVAKVAKAITEVVEVAVVAAMGLPGAEWRSSAPRCASYAFWKCRSARAVIR